MARFALQSQDQVQLDDLYLVALAKQGSADAYGRIVRRYRGFVRLKASSYFLAGSWLATGGTLPPGLGAVVTRVRGRVGPAPRPEPRAKPGAPQPFA